MTKELAIFQSTPPARGATLQGKKVRWSWNKFQSTPPARGATWVNGKEDPALDISIHAPREGGDFSYLFLLSISTISIHAPREGGDPLRDA